MTTWELQQSAELGYWTAQNMKAIGRQLGFVLRHFFGLPYSFFAPYEVLEIGTGPVGFLSLFTARRKYGIEPLKEQLEKVFKLPGDVEFIGKRAEEIPLGDASVDVILCFNVIPTHVEDSAKCLSEIYRVLKPGGLFVFGMKDDQKDQFHQNILSRQQMRKAIAVSFAITREIDRYRMYGLLCAKPKAEVQESYPYQPLDTGFGDSTGGTTDK